MKKVGKILCILFALALIAVGIFAWRQRDNLMALYRAKTMDADEILQEAKEKGELRQKELEEYGITLKIPTQEELDALIEGRSIGGAETGGDTAPAGQTAAGQPTAEQPAAETLNDKPLSAKELIERCVQELYDCQDALMARLGVMKQAALDEWHSLPGQEQTKDKKLEIGYRGLDDCYELEVEIDGQVQGILARYSGQLRDIRADTAPMETLWKYYCEEKASAKAYYMNKYL